MNEMTPIAYLSHWVSLSSIFNWLTSSAFAALLVFGLNFLVNRRKEKKLLRVYCTILLVETELNKMRIAGMLNNDPFITEIIKSSPCDTEWNQLKHQPAFHHLETDDFKTILSFYNEVKAIKSLISEPLPSLAGITLPQPALKRSLDLGEAACTILSRKSA